MLDRDIAKLALSDLRAAFGLLSRLPLRATAVPRPEGVWAWPLVGASLAALATLFAALANAGGLPAGLVAALAMVVAAILTGALHEDGLADCIDGFFGGQAKARRLEIMKDSQIGAFGTLGLVLITLTKWAALSAIVSAADWGAIIAAGALSRAPMAALMAALPNARGAGLSHRVGAPSARSAAMAAAISVVIACVLMGSAGVVMAIAVTAIAFGVASVATAKIGGQTGDVLGAAQQLAEAAALIVAVAVF